MNPIITKQLPKVFIFDVGGTIMDVNNFSLEKGLDYLYENVIDNSKVTLEEFKLSMADVRHIYRNRELNNMELSFEYFLNYVTFIYGKKTNMTFEEIEDGYAHSVYQPSQIKNVTKFIELLQSKGVKLYVLSNAMFSTRRIRKEVALVDCEKYFIDIISTGDHVWRKPGEDIFQMYIKKLKFDGYTNSDLCYIGNSFRFDMVPTIRLGMNAIFFNVEEAKDLSNTNYLQVNNYDELIELFKDL